MTHAGRLALFLLVTVMGGASTVVARAAEPEASAGSGDDVVDPAAGLPATAPGRQVLLDSRVVVAERKRTLRLSDIDPEQADIVREINRKPGTWQLYLLYTAEDLPDKFFHPGFAIRFKPRPLPADVAPDAAPPASSPAAAPAR